MLRTLSLWLCLGLLGVFALDAQAGGSGLNVVVIVNQNSTNSVQLGNYYCAMRNVPPQNYLRINWTGGNTEWQLSDFTNTLLNPFLAMLSSRQLTNQIDYVVLSMDIPYRINGGSEYYNSTTAALFYGFKNDPNYEVSGQIQCEVASGSANQYAGSESIFRQAPPSGPGSNAFMVTMITASNLAVAEMIVSQGAISDGTFPTQTVWLGKSLDTYRNLRYTEFDNTVFNTRLRGNYSVMRTNIGTLNSAYVDFNGPILGYENGNYTVNIDPSTPFVPGSMADNLTSSSGNIFEDTAGATTSLKFIGDGATGSYGTVVEPCDYIQKFPDSQTYFYQARGFSLAECYYQSLTNPYQGLVVGEPLAAPFAQTGSGAWIGFATNAIFSGITNISGLFKASDAQHPLQQVDLFLDGLWLQTVTNVTPQSGNVLNVSLNGYATSYTVPANATVTTIASNLVTVLNGATYKNNTKITAYDHGDRVELQSTAGYTKTGTQIPVSVSSTNSSGSLTTFIDAANAAPTNFLDSTAEGIRGYSLTGSLLSSSTLTLSVTKTNNAVVTVTVTNNGNSTLTEFAQQFINAINGTSSLQGPDGLYGADAQTSSTGGALFNLIAMGQGYAAAQIKATVSASIGIVVSPSGANTLTQNVSDLQPREHFYITAGVTNLAFTVPFATTNFADGHHELTAVAYEGSSVHTQTRATQDIVIKNSSLSATLTPSLTGSSSNLQPTLLITVTANTNNISSIQLFSTGGLLASATNQSSATFTITYSNLDVGAHSFYAIVTQGNGQQYRTQTQNIGLVGVSYQGSSLFGVDYRFPLTVSGTTPTLTWPATAGRSYTVLSTTNLLTPFQTRATVVPTSSLGQWTETNTTPAQQFYRVSVNP